MSKKCRKCKKEIPQGKARYRTADGALCPTCVGKLTKLERANVNVEWRKFEWLLAAESLREEDNRKIRLGQKLVLRTLFPVAGPLKIKSIKMLNDIVDIAKGEKNIHGQTLKILSLLKSRINEIEKEITDALKNVSVFETYGDECHLSKEEEGK